MASSDSAAATLHGQIARTGHDKPQRIESSGISVLVVGAGVGGEMAALECWRQGHDVRVIERAANRLLSGDGFTIGHSAIRTLRYWPAMVEENEKIAFDPWISYHTITGEKLSEPAPLFPAKHDNTEGADDDAPHKTYRHSRPKFHKMLCDQAERHGIKIEYNKRAMQFYEDATSAKAGVLLESGEKIEADVVIAADGIGSKSSGLTLGQTVRASPTGYAVYRAAFPVEVAVADPLTREQFKPLDDGTPLAQMWMGENYHAVFISNDDEMSWVLNYPDDKKVQESWSNLIDPETVLKTTAKIPGWPEVADRLIRLTPADRCHDFKLMWREPQPTWISPLGRVVQIGDAAHTFLPSSGNGATQAIEDAVSLATCLRLAGKEDVGLATRVHNKLRFERVSCLQMLGILNQDMRDHAAKNSTKEIKPIGLLGAWIWRHDPENYAIQNFEAAKANLVDATPFANTNIPPGYVPKPWTIDEIRTMAKAGDIQLEGNWD